MRTRRVCPSIASTVAVVAIAARQIMPQTIHNESDPLTGFLSTVANRLRHAKAVVLLVGALALAGCAETTEPLEVTNTSVRGVELPADLAQVRTEVLEMCNTGEGSSEVRKAWTDLGFEEETGTKWIDALAFSGDFGYDPDPQTVIYDSTVTYPVIEQVSENCLEAAKLLSSGVGTASVEDATAVLDELRALPYVPTTEILTQIANNMDYAKENGIIE